MNAGFVNAVEMLPMPKLPGLAATQVDGTVCVWCGNHPDGGGIRLGPRISVIGGALQRWEPRACRRCTGLEAARVYRLHLTTCARCMHRDHCPDSHALHALAEEYR